ncbi:hypothetical protein [Marinococcus sp. PL1-022]|uniref:hypothetical protein n=1 Tax=Marinococcus sp. PL1-022 TaxID=3095363 RepID=UPI0029C50BC4|nr:hypothetical protein [Marinococcus sp. PL1-022]MDX6151998.1 hypothetical protein [Marinococcus sp. PL1-022]
MDNEKLSFYKVTEIIDEETLELIEDTKEVFEKHIPYYKYIILISNFLGRKRMEKTLLGAGDFLSNGKGYTEKEKTKLKNHLEKRELLREVTSLFLDKAQQVYSEKVARILGVYLGMVVAENLESEHQTAIFLQALSSLNDYDIEYFIKAYDFMMHPETKRAVSAAEIIFRKIEDPDYPFPNKDISSIHSCEASLNKLHSVQLLKTEILMRDDVVSFKTNAYSKSFYKLLKKYEELT